MECWEAMNEPIRLDDDDRHCIQSSHVHLVMCWIKVDLFHPEGAHWQELEQSQLTQI